MDKTDKIEQFYKELYQYEFILKHGFERFRFGSEEFFACASTIISSSGRKLTISFNIHDESPDEVELVIQFLNRCSMEQIRTIGQKIATQKNHEIDLYEEPGCISMVSYYPAEDTGDAVEMMLTILAETEKAVLFMVGRKSKG